MADVPDDRTELATRVVARDPWVGVMIAGKYLLVRHIAAGGFGDVYEARQQLLKAEKTVAVKLLKTEIAADAENVQRFEDEVRAIARLAHPNICNVTDAGRHEATYFLVMDYADGGSLHDALVTTRRDGRKLDPELVRRWLIEAASGLLAAEQNHANDGTPEPINHFDIKPANLLLKGGRVLVADFGAARLGGPKHRAASQGSSQYSWGYASPEQHEASADHRADIYALGVSGYRLLTGELPAQRFVEKDDRFSEPHDPHSIDATVPARLGAVIARMTAPRVEDRFASFADVIAALEELAVRPRHRGLVALLFAALLGVVGIGLGVATGAIQLGTHGPLVERLGDVVDGLDKMEAQVAAQLDRSDWQALEDLERSRNDLRERVRGLRTRLGKLIDERGRDARTELDEFECGLDARLKLDKELRSLASRTEEAAEVRDALEAGIQAIPQTSVERAIQDLAAQRSRLRGLDVSALEELATRYEAAIASVRSERDRTVGELERLVASGEFATFEARSGADRAVLAAADETARTARIDALSSLIRDARELCAGLPPWPADLIGPQALAALGGVVKSYGATSVPSNLDAWWQGELARRGVLWRDRIRSWLVEWTGSVNAAIETANQRCQDETISRDAYDRAASTRGELLQVLVELERMALEPGQPLAHVADFSRTLAESRERIRVLAPFPTGLSPAMQDLARLVGRTRETERWVASRSGDVRSFAERFLALADAMERDLAAWRMNRGNPPRPVAEHAATLLELERDVAEVGVLAMRRDGLRRQLRGGCDPAIVAYGAGSLPSQVAGRPGAGSEVVAVVAAATDALGVSRALPCFTAAEDPWQHCESFVEVAKRRLAVRTPDGDDVRAWFDATQQNAILPASAVVATHFAAIAEGLQRDLERGGVDGPGRDTLHARIQRLDRLAEDLEDLVRRRSRWFAPELRDALKAARPHTDDLGGVRAAAPEGWPADLVPPAGVRSVVLTDTPEFQRIYPPEFLAAQTGRLRIWYFEQRVEWIPGSAGQNGELRPVPMVLVRDGDAAWLVDVHEVTLWEMDRHCGLFGPPRHEDPRGVFASRDGAGGYFTSTVTERDPSRPRDVLAFRVKWDIARQFGEELARGLGVGFRPPQIAEWRQLEATARSHACSATPAPPRVSADLTDVTDEGVRGLRSGLSEWVAGETGPVGATAYERRFPRDGQWVFNSGFRLVVPLQKL